MESINYSEEIYHKWTSVGVKINNRKSGQIFLLQID